MFSAALWVAHASRVLAMASSPSRTSSFRSKSESDGEIHGKFVSARRRKQHARRVRSQLFARPTALAAESGAASVSYGVSEWGLVWVSVSDSQWRWQLGSECSIGVASRCGTRSCRGCRSRGGRWCRCWSGSCSCSRGSSGSCGRGCCRCSSWTSRRRRCRSSCWQPKGIDPVIRTEVDPTTSDHAGVPLPCAGHQFVGAAAGINNGAGVPIIGVQALIATTRAWQRTTRSYCLCRRSS